MDRRTFDIDCRSEAQTTGPRRRPMDRVSDLSLFWSCCCRSPPPHGGGGPFCRRGGVFGWSEHRCQLLAPPVELAGTAALVACQRGNKGCVWVWLMYG
ncbi:hypothetical protein Hanom_Chr09g00783761 [Helianthus anomalus]